MFGFNYIAFIPALVKDTFDLTDGYVGVIMSASAIGAVAVAVSIARHADGPRAFHLMIVSAGVFGGAVMVLGLAPTFVAACVVTIFIGAGATGYQSLSNTLALGLSDEEHRGRVQSLLMLSFAGFGIAALPLGLLAEAIGLRPAIVLMGVVAMVAGVLFFVLDAAIDRIARNPCPTTQGLSSSTSAARFARAAVLPPLEAGGCGVDPFAVRGRRRARRRVQCAHASSSTWAYSARTAAT